MKRLSIKLTEAALNIYNKVTSHKRSAWVSEAIEEKHTKEQSVFTPHEEQRIREIIKEESK